ncbi:MAG TPA: Calx-beta domain-containing protein, partial [Pyrinomonadaceae bacterium]|nr:Calx-beta domain-containing protein [Pyrinomonadaceae bacterium]
KLNPAGAALVYRYDLGASGAKVGGLDVDVDASGNAYVTGSIAEGNITVRNGFQTAHANLPDAVLVKLNSTGTDILYSTYMGGDGADFGLSVAVDDAGNAYVAGSTNSTNFPVREALQPFNGGGTDAFVTKINTNAASAASLDYSTYFGINYNEAATGVALDAQGSAYVSGLVYTAILPGIIHTGINSNTVMDLLRSDSLISPFALKIADSASSTLQFSAASYQVAENGGAKLVTVTRTGDTSNAATVAYATVDGTASELSDYAKASGTLHFAPGDTIKTFSILITDDAYVEGNETVNLILRNQTGATALGSPMMAQLTISDNDTAQSQANPIDDAGFFVRQHYADFLNRLPDEGGLDYWTNRIMQCGSDASCINAARRDVSAAYFIEAEFQLTGAFLIRVYRAALGRQPTYAEFVRDRVQLVVGSNLEASKQSFLNEFVQRAEFAKKYPVGMSGGEFADALLNTVRNTTGVDLSDQRSSLVAEYTSSASRARVVRMVVDNTTFSQAEYNPAFVLAEYFGYLRRDPDAGGYQFWVDVLNRLPAPNSYLSMVCAFITSTEYQRRFGPQVSRTNSECAQ